MLITAIQQNDSVIHINTNTHTHTDVHMHVYIHTHTYILRYADDTTLMAESEEELKSLLMKVKEESKKLA